MAINQNLNLKMDQKLVMTPQLQLAIKLLQMQTLDLQSFVDQELMENPFLSSDDGTSENENTSSEKSEKDSLDALESQDMTDNDHMALDTDWDRMYDSGRASPSSAAPVDDGESSWENMATEEKTLKTHLLDQLGIATKDTVLKFLASFLIDAIDDSGYLHIDMEETAENLNVGVKKLEEAKALIQSFEPAGVGASSLEECLRLQLIANLGELSYAEDIVLKNLELLAVQDFKKLSKLAKAPEDEVMEICASITELTPKPGLKYGSSEANNIIPDVIVRNKNGKWSAELNVDAMPKVLLNSLGSSLASAAGKDKDYVAERVNRAQWLVKSLEQRAKTIYKVANAIVQAQEDFFNYGVESLKPMTLKVIAETVEAHESTISRVTNGKYMQTPKGVFELKYFFSSAIGTTGGNISVASESVKEIIKRMIGEEDARKPLSDEKLVQMLKQEGIEVARRTVAKYREAAGIPSSSGRRLKA